MSESNKKSRQLSVETTGSQESLNRFPSRQDSNDSYDSRKQPNVTIIQPPLSPGSNLFNNNQQLEESQTFIHELLQKLDNSNASEDASEAGFMISNMEGILGQFSETQFELQHEISEILESSRHGLLTHEKLSEMIAMEQTRSNFVNSIVNSLKGQIENLFHVLNETLNMADDEVDKREAGMHQIQSDVAMMMKSVDSLQTVVKSPAKKLDITIKRIDSELVVHLNDQYKFKENWDVEHGGKLNEQQEKKSKQIPLNAKKAAIIRRASITKPVVSDKETSSDEGDSDDGIRHNHAPLEKPTKARKHRGDSDEEYHSTQDNNSVPNSSRINSKMNSARGDHNTDENVDHTGDGHAKGKKHKKDKGEKGEKSEKKHKHDKTKHRNSSSGLAVLPAASEDTLTPSMAKKLRRMNDLVNQKEDPLSAPPPLYFSTPAAGTNSSDTGNININNHNNGNINNQQGQNYDNHHNNSNNTTGGFASNVSSVSTSPINNNKNNSSGNNFSGNSIVNNTIQQNNNNNNNNNNSSVTNNTSNKLPALSGVSNLTATNNNNNNNNNSTNHSQPLISPKVPTVVVTTGSNNNSIVNNNNITHNAINNTTNRVFNDDDSLSVGSELTTNSPLPVGYYNPNASNASKNNSGGKHGKNTTKHNKNSSNDGIMRVSSNDSAQKKGKGIAVGKSGKSNTNAQASEPYDPYRGTPEPDMEAILANVTMTNREKAMAEREEALRLKISQNEVEIAERVQKLWDAKQAVDKRIQASLSAAGYVKRSEIAHLINAKPKDKAKALLLKSRATGFKPDEKTASAIPLTMEMIFENHDILEMMLEQNPDLDSDALIQQLQTLFSDPHQSNASIQKKLMLLMTGEEVDDSFMIPSPTAAGSMIYNDSLITGDSKFGHNNSTLENNKPRSPASELKYSKINLVKTNLKGGNKSGKGVNQPGFNINSSNNNNNSSNDMFDDDFDMEDDNINAILLPHLINHNNNSNNGRNALTKEMLNTIYNNINKTGKAVNLETIKIIAPYNRNEITALEISTSTDDLADFILAQQNELLNSTIDMNSNILQGSTDSTLAMETKINPMLPPLSAGTAGALEISNLDHSADPTYLIHNHILDLNISRPLTGNIDGNIDNSNRLTSPMNDNTRNLPFGGKTIVPNTHLRIYDNQADLLLTRTYQPEPHNKTFEEYLAEAQNPLYVLYCQYHPLLSRLQKIRLASVAVNENKITSEWSINTALRQMLTVLFENIQLIVKDCDQMLLGVESAEEIVSSLVALLKVSSKDAAGIISNSIQVHELYKQYGEIEAVKISVDLQMHEFRTLFERISTVSHHELANLMKESTEMSLCYKHFIACQGKSVEVHQRLLSCKERCTRYKLIHNLTSAHRASFNQTGAAATGHNNMHSGTQGMSPNQREGTYNPDRSGFYTNNSQYIDENIYALYSQLQDEVEALKSDLEVADEDIADLEDELQEIINKQDRSPSALLFFTLLHDPSYVSNLQQLVLQLTHLKPFADGNMTHMDFLTLKKRIQVCTVCIPGVDKLLSYYNQIYTKWSTHRNNWFASRNVTGGAADGLASCPLCYHNLGGDLVNRHDFAGQKQMEGVVLVNHGSPLRRRPGRKQVYSGGETVRLKGQQQQQQQQQQGRGNNMRISQSTSKLPHI